MIKMSAVERRRRNIILPGDGAETHLDVYTYLIFFLHPPGTGFPPREGSHKRTYIYVHVMGIQTYASPATLARPPAEC